ncbi:hypothetical protein FDG2_4140 [Candidatus Protofrankia californiensis]|uniref:CdiI C-terminal domain-containing protein n=1 Tax=Candidatus Protofrankia californiensis TaxID=1839754 RepID=A0A1C3P3Q2_9ACTN|nr:hypothetical protein FDG2_4140 [Candidatus Protofrankia californiensis]
MFRIAFSDHHDRADDFDGLVGKIVAGGLDETFEAPIGKWTQSDYESSWRGELLSLLRGEDVAVLLTVTIDPREANWLRGYTLYRFGDEVRIQERMFLMDELDHGFDLRNPSNFASRYESVNENGRRISEWVVSLADIRRFLESEC